MKHTPYYACNINSDKLYINSQENVTLTFNSKHKSATAYNSKVKHL